MIRCDGCERVGDAKDEWLDGLYEDKSPFRFWCPDCVEQMTDQGMVLALKTQDYDRYKELTE